MHHPTPSDVQPEALLEIIQEQRGRHLRRHPHLATDTIFNAQHMREICNTWMHDYRTWMYPDDMVAKYESCFNSQSQNTRQRARQMRRPAFSADLFRFIGNKRLLLACTKHLICSAEQPAASFGIAAINRFLEDPRRCAACFEHENAPFWRSRRVRAAERLKTYGSDSQCCVSKIENA